MLKRNKTGLVSKVDIYTGWLVQSNALLPKGAVGQRPQSPDQKVAVRILLGTLYFFYVPLSV